MAVSVSIHVHTSPSPPQLFSMSTLSQSLNSVEKEPGDRLQRHRTCIPVPSLPLASWPCGLGERETASDLLCRAWMRSSTPLRKHEASRLSTVYSTVTQ